MKKVLFVATVVKTHIMEFHIPYLKMFQDMGWETAVAARNDYEDPPTARFHSAILTMTFPLNVSRGRRPILEPTGS